MQQPEKPQDQKEVIMKRIMKIVSTELVEESRHTPGILHTAQHFNGWTHDEISWVSRGNEPVYTVGEKIEMTLELVK